MSQAEELLNGLSEEGNVAVAAIIDNEPHIVIGKDKFITVPSDLRRIAVQHEHNVKTVTFDCPRYWDGRDLMDMVITINYKTPNGVLGMKEVENVTIDSSDDTIIHFDWTITKVVTQMNGTLSFLACGKKLNDEGIEEQHWNSELNREMTISEGMECTPSIIDDYPDVVTDILARLRNLENGKIEVALDETLTVEGKAADAKATGDALVKQKLLIVTLDENEEYASHSASEINAHINAGGLAVLEVGSPMTAFAYPHYRSAAEDQIPIVIFGLIEVVTGVTQTLYSIGNDKSCTQEAVTPNYGESASTTGKTIAYMQITEGVDGSVTFENTFTDGTSETIALPAGDKPDSVTYNGVAIPITWVTETEEGTEVSE